MGHNDRGARRHAAARSASAPLCAAQHAALHGALHAASCAAFVGLVRRVALLRVWAISAALVVAAPVAHAQRGQQASTAAAASPAIEQARQHTNRALAARRQALDAWQAAAKRRDDSAQRVNTLKTAGVGGTVLEKALRDALVHDEEARRARAALSARDAAVADAAAALMKAYDADLAQRRRRIETLPPDDVRRRAAAEAYAAAAAQRDAMRRALQPALAPGRGVGAAARAGDVDAVDDVADAQEGDDVDSLLERADLARDLEQRYRRQADAVAARIRELEEERAVARDVGALGRAGVLFDEESRRLFVVRSDLSPAPQPARGGTSTSGGVSSPSPAPAAGAAESDSAASDGAAPPAADADPVVDVGPIGPPTSGDATSGGMTSFGVAERAFEPAQSIDRGAGVVTSRGDVDLNELRALEQQLRRKQDLLKRKQAALRAAARAAR